MAPQKTCRRAGAGAALAGSALLAARAFVPGASAPGAVTSPAPGAPALRGAALGAAQENSAYALVGAASLVAAAVGGRVARRAEPITAAAAAAAAAKAAAGAAGAAKGASAAAAGAKASAVAGAKAAGSSTGVAAGTGKSIKGNEDVEPSPSFDPSTELGAMPPLGYFDPAGFCKKGDLAGFRNLRAAEIKHGRVAMMAALGAVVQHYVKLPGFETVPAGLGAVAASPGTLGFAALFAVAGFLELVAWTEDPSKEPGNFGDPVGFNQYNQEMRERELNNGRFGMFAAIGIIAAELVTGKDAIQQFGLA
eukprot:TRINITY_DN14652_c0_g1_i1.p1 TRINITY_DN14652_c0_g1~~TRINITY_DN14652_c0_g1_i1.p1  ORF type:complete len:325 (+),score=97.70 TRINITY_DN14652_c0_g1_i1:54-977(+)